MSEKIKWVANKMPKSDDRHLGIMSTPAVVIDGRVMCAGACLPGRKCGNGSREAPTAGADPPAPRRDAIKNGRRIRSVHSPRSFARSGEASRVR